MIAVADAGPLVAAVDSADPGHVRSAAVLQRPGLEIVIPALVVAEVSYFLARRLGARIEAGFLRGLGEVEVESPQAEDWSRIADLVEQYADFPLGGTDASVVALAERLETDVLITLDRQHFGAIKPRHCEAFRLLPE